MKGMNSTPNHHHEQLLVGWKWGAMETERGPRHQDDNNDNDNDNDNNKNDGHQHPPDGNWTMTKMKTTMVGPWQEDKDHNNN
jgi:hypothetical protein